jgi:flavin reductase (DIM6/NTAB) family NADH-FMN oxidoreductase RutF
MLYTKDDLKALDRKYRLNLINSITGIKPANLVGTRSKENQYNVAIFSSLVHLGSNPAHLGLVIRPQMNGLKDTYSNIIETSYYTINQISEDFIKKAHYTSAKLPKEYSEFDMMKLEREFKENFWAPFVACSFMKIGMKLIEAIPLPNGCVFIVGEILLAQIPDESVNEKGQIDLSKFNAVGIGGLNSYYRLEKIADYPYVRTNQIPDFDA